MYITLFIPSSGLKWRSRRRLLTPAFHFQILESFFDVFNEQSLKLVADMELASKAAATSSSAATLPTTDESLGGDGSSQYKAINVYTILTQCALDIICGWPTSHSFFFI